MTGLLPSSVARLSNLRTMSLGHTDLEGPFTSYLSNWTELQIFDIQQTLLTGSLPTTIGLLTKLKMLIADQCQLEGTIPSELALLSNALELLSLGGPNLNGTLPESIGDLTLLSKYSFLGDPHNFMIPPVNSILTGDSPLHLLLCLFREP
jgi:Leucine-rich repeat (LRR) protein